jgi:hypothetical protein
MDLTAIETVAGQLVDMGWKMKEMDLELFKDQKKLASTSNFGPPWNPFAASSSFSHQFLGLKTLPQNSF